MVKITDFNANVNVKDSDISVKHKKKDGHKGLFELDGTLTKVEKQALRKNDGINLSRMEIRKYSDMEGGTQFLDNYVNLEKTIENPDELKVARQKLVLDYFVGTDALDDVANEIRSDVNRFGVDNAALDSYMFVNRLNHKRPRATIMPDPTTGDTIAIPIRLVSYKDNEGNIKSLHVYEKEDGLNSEYAAPSRFLEAEGEYFIQKGEPTKYYRLNGNTLTDVTLKFESEKVAAAATETSEVEIENDENTLKSPKFSDVFAKNKTVNIIETGSKQRLTSANEWSTNIIVPKKAKYNKNGIPSQIGIELPPEYGWKGPDGIAQKRYTVLNLVDAESNIYSDKAGIRKFQMAVSEDGISFNAVDIDDKKVKVFLDTNTKAVQAEAEKSGLNDAGTKMKIRNLDDAQKIVGMLSDRNQAWETYLQLGTDNGYLTGSNGLLEKITDEGKMKNADGTVKQAMNTYNDIAPAIQGLLAAVPNVQSIKTSPEYQAVTELVNQLSQTDGKLNDSVVRKLDTALMNLAKNHMQNLQNVNYAHNSFLVGGQGKVIIQPDKPSSMWMTDAKFDIGGDIYYFYQQRGVMDRTIDFQDLVENKDDGKRDHLHLIYNDITGNNRHGEIKFNYERVGDKTFYFKNYETGQKFFVKVENGNAYIAKNDGTIYEPRVTVEDLLNGRKQMPQEN